MLYLYIFYILLIYFCWSNKVDHLLVSQGYDRPKAVSPRIFGRQHLVFYSPRAPHLDQHVADLMVTLSSCCMKRGASVLALHQKVRVLPINCNVQSLVYHCDNTKKNTQSYCNWSLFMSHNMGNLGYLGDEWPSGALLVLQRCTAVWWGTSLSLVLG